jgi:hypothetical protein
MNVDTVVATLGQVIALQPPASQKALLKAERRFGPIPHELRDFYARANGTVEATPVKNGWTRLWSMNEWCSVSSLGCGPVYDDVQNAIVVADYSLESWWYAVDIGPVFGGSVYIVDGGRPTRVVARSFGAFVSMVVQDDQDIYPADGAG